MMNCLKAWRIRRLECYLASHKAKRAEMDRMERITGNVYRVYSVKLAGEIARLEKQIEQLRGTE